MEAPTPADIRRRLTIWVCNSEQPLHVSQHKQQLAPRTRMRAASPCLQAQHSEPGGNVAVPHGAHVRLHGQLQAQGGARSMCYRTATARKPPVGLHASLEACISASQQDATLQSSPEPKALCLHSTYLDFRATLRIRLGIRVGRGKDGQHCWHLRRGMSAESLRQGGDSLAHLSQGRRCSARPCAASSAHASRLAPARLWHIELLEQRLLRFVHHGKVHLVPPEVGAARGGGSHRVWQAKRR